MPKIITTANGPVDEWKAQVADELDSQSEGQGVLFE